MPARIRLQRHGKKGMPFYHIVVADGRAPRDGKFIERIGTYNPIAIPAEINLDFEKALQWLRNGAQPSDTARAILVYKGVIFKNHLLKGVAKGALTLEQVEEKFQAWMQEKEAKIVAKKNEVTLTKKEALKARKEAEVKANIAKGEEVAKKRAQELAKEHQARMEAQAQNEEAVAEEEVAVEDVAVAEEVAVEEVAVAEEVAVVEAEVVAEEVTATEEAPAVDEVAPATDQTEEEKAE